MRRVGIRRSCEAIGEKAVEFIRTAKTRKRVRRGDFRTAEFMSRPRSPIF